MKTITIIPAFNEERSIRPIRDSVAFSRMLMRVKQA
jgi:hypothetical protein